MNTKLIGYWGSTGLFCLVFFVGGIANLLRVEPQREIMEGLGYPVYLMTFLGIAKLLGVITLLVPGFPRLKEWAYAGFMFDMLGAAFSHAYVGDPMASVMTPIVILVIGAASYLSRPDSRRL